jgi:heme-degrading monooxygenase HmoA
MHARVMSGQVQPEAIEAFERVIEEAVLPCAREQRGFRGAVGLIDRETGRGMLITYWNSPDDLIATEANGYLNTQIARVVPFLKGPAVRESFEVESNLSDPFGGLSGFDVLSGSDSLDVTL